MKNIRFFFSENSHFLVVKFSVYLNRRVFVMIFSRSGLGFLMGKFSLFLTVIFPPHDIFMLLCFVSS